jgi:hypothetical protein
MLSRVKFTVSPPGADRMHHVTEEDVRVVLSRLPVELWQRLRAVHFNDGIRGGRFLGYVNQGRREIALCALPPRMSLGRFMLNGRTPERFGAVPGVKWPELALRRFLLYEVFLHEVGHLQPVVERRRSDRLKFAREPLAHEFAAEWRKRLWSEPFDHPDPVHNPPSLAELETVPRCRSKADASDPTLQGLSLAGTLLSGRIPPISLEEQDKWQRRSCDGIRDRRSGPTKIGWPENDRAASHR